MKSLIVIFVCVFLAKSQSALGENPAFVNQINEAWTEANYTIISTILDQRLQSSPSDLTALYVATQFYTLIQPNKSKALAAANAFKNIIDQTSRQSLKNFAAQLVTSISSIPEDKFLPLPQQALDALHQKSPDQFPLMAMALKFSDAQP